MRATVLDLGESRRSRWLLLGFLLSLGLHGVVALGVSRIPERTRNAAEWMQLQIRLADPPPAAPEPPPEPLPKPPKPKTPIKSVLAPLEVPPIPIEQLPPTPPDAPPPEKKVRRLIQGLDANSFSPGAGTGLAVRAGNTTATRATQETLSLDQATDFVVRPFASVSTPPKLRGAMPDLVVPQEVMDLSLEGVVEIDLTIDAFGSVARTRVTRSLHPKADDACESHFQRNTRWEPATLDGAPVAVTGLRKTCRFLKIED